MTLTTRTPGILGVGSTLSDPPFELVQGGTPAGFDVAWMDEIAEDLGLTWRLIAYETAILTASSAPQ